MLISGFTGLLALIRYLQDVEMVSKSRSFIYDIFENIGARKPKFTISIDFEKIMSAFLEQFLIWSLL